MSYRRSCRSKCTSSSSSSDEKSSCHRGKSSCRKIKYCCKQCGHDGKLKIKYELPEAPIPVYATVALVTALSLTNAVPTTILFNSVIANSRSQSCSRYSSDPNVYNPATGVFTVPRCGKGIYNITTHITASAATEGSSSVLVEIRVNNLPVSQSLIQVASGSGFADTDITINYPLQPGQTVTVVATATFSAGVLTLVNPATNFSIVRVSDLIC